MMLVRQIAGRHSPLTPSSLFVFVFVLNFFFRLYFLFFASTMLFMKVNRRKIAFVPQLPIAFGLAQFSTGVPVVFWTSSRQGRSRCNMTSGVKAADFVSLNSDKLSVKFIIVFTLSLNCTFEATKIGCLVQIYSKMR